MNLYVSFALLAFLARGFTECIMEKNDGKWRQTKTKRRFPPV